MKDIFLNYVHPRMRQVLEAVFLGGLLVLAAEFVRDQFGPIPNISVVFSILVVFLTLVRGAFGGLIVCIITFWYVFLQSLDSDTGLTILEVNRLIIIGLFLPSLVMVVAILRGRFERIIAGLRNELSARVRNEELLQAEIQARNATEEALRRTETEYRNLFEHNPNPMWIYDLETLQFLAVNNLAIERYGYSREQFLAMTIADIRDPEDIPRLRSAVAARRDRNYSAPRLWRHRKADGKHIDVEISSDRIEFNGRPAVVVLANDVTDKLQLEAQFLQAQKMETVGRLAGGVAHDFNNLLTVIIGSTMLLRDELADGPPHLLDDLDEIDRAAQRAADLTHRLLTFARKQVFLAELTDLNALILDMDRMLRRLIGETIELVTRPAVNMPHVMADEAQISQVLVNLVVNARDAMPDGGQVLIETDIVSLDAIYAAQHVGVNPGQYAVLAVSDTGQGIAAEHLPQIFEPFFTTKPQGEGTGLGLATSYGIVKQHGGHIAVYSEYGHGSTFRVYLPLHTETPAIAGGADDAQPHGNETILVVEDDHALLQTTVRMLREFGYTVLEATDAEAAFEQVDATQAPIDLLFTDVIMPVTGGIELADRLAQQYPHLRVLFTSGYTGATLLHRRYLTSRAAYLAKPYSVDALMHAVRQALDTTAAFAETNGSE
ncbi:MAG TPA: ATP-binding protein [Roseiflexaceae bacterium]|nr:ATP-binding protein [Roseiflexaceae bacterium]HMP40869.1 ATP-binding protein [Roseiflexaceae bacterium]